MAYSCNPTRPACMAYSCDPCGRTQHCSPRRSRLTAAIIPVETPYCSCKLQRAAGRAHRRRRRWASPAHCGTARRRRRRPHRLRAMSRGLQLQPLRRRTPTAAASASALLCCSAAHAGESRLTAATPVENLHCSCMLTSVQPAADTAVQAMWDCAPGGPPRVSCKAVHPQWRDSCRARPWFVHFWPDGRCGVPHNMDYPRTWRPQSPRIVMYCVSVSMN